jgi:hypothetical protein
LYPLSQTTNIGGTPISAHSQHILRNGYCCSWRHRLGAMKKKLVPLDPEYVNELEVFGGMLKQADHRGDSGWGGRDEGTLP